MSAAPVTVAPRLRAPLAAPATPYQRERRILGDPTPLACTVARQALEVALGGDGLDRLNTWVTAEIRSQVARQQSLSRRAAYQVRGAVGIVRVRVCRIGPSAAEVTVIASEGERVHPIAMRLEEAAGRWLTTALELG